MAEGSASIDTAQTADLAQGNEAWRRILWARQPFPDNYVSPEFLKQLQTHPVHALPNLTDLIVWSLALSQYLCLILTFVGLFLHLREGWISAEVLATCCTGVIAFCAFSMPSIATNTMSNEATNVLMEDSSESRLRNTASSKAGKKTTDQTLSLANRRRAFAQVMSYALLGLVILALSPLLKTLTESTTSDSIAALSTTLFLLSFGLADFSATSNADTRRKRTHSSTSTVQRAGMHRRRSSSSSASQGIDASTLPTSQTHLPAALSLNAALCASIVLASRLRSPIDVFSLVLAAIALFAFLPRFLKTYAGSCGESFGETHYAYTRRRTILALCTTFFMLLTSSTLLASFSYTAAMANVATCLFLSFVCPAWMRKAQGWKEARRGPWDMGVPRLRVRSNSYL